MRTPDRSTRSFSDMKPIAMRSAEFGNEIDETAAGPAFLLHVVHLIRNKISEHIVRYVYCFVQVSSMQHSIS